MSTEDMYNYLYNEYQEIKSAWNDALSNLQGHVRDLGQARRDLAQLRIDLDLYQSSVLLAETRKDGRISGSNAEKRKLQAKTLLANLPDEDPDYAALVTAIDQTQLLVDTLQVDIEVLQLRVTFLRNQSRMVAGLAYSVAG